MIKDILQKEIKLNQWHYFLLLLITIISMVCMNVGDIVGPFIIHDEAGYWNAAAYFSGYDWSELMNRASYYSFGYSLMLMPFYLLGVNAVFMYKAAIVLNGIMLGISFILACDITKRIYGRFNVLSVLISFFSVFTCNNLVQANVGWSETAILLFCWLIADVIVRIIEEETTIKWIILSLLTVYIYYIHHRMIGLCAVVLLWSLFMFLRNRTDKKSIILFCVVGVTLCVVFHMMKENLISNQYYSVNNTELPANNYDGVFAKIKTIFSSWENIGCMLASFLGKLFYFGKSTWLLLYFSIIFSIKELKAFIKHKIKMNKSTHFMMLALLLLLSEIAVSAVYMWKAGRNDNIYYGRYAEPLSGLLMLATIVYIYNNFLYNKKELLKYVVGIVVAHISFGVIAYAVLWQNDLKFWGIMCTSLSLYFTDYGCHIIPFGIISLIALILLVLMLRTKNIVPLLLFVAIVTIFEYNYEYSNAGNTKDSQGYNKALHQMIEYVEDDIELVQVAGSKMKQSNLYYVWSDEFQEYVSAYLIQHYLYDVEINFRYMEDFDDMKKEDRVVFISKNIQGYNEFIKDKEIILENFYICIFRY